MLAQLIHDIYLLCLQREKMLKNRMKKKKRKARQRIRKTSAQLLDQIQKQVRAIASFRGSQPTDLDFTVGDTITVIATVR